MTKEEEKKMLEGLAAAQEDNPQGPPPAPVMANTVSAQESAMSALKQKAEEQPSVPVAHPSLSAPAMANTVTTQESAMPAMKQKAETEDKMFIPGMGFRHFGTQELAAIRQNWNNRPETPEQYQERMKREARNKMFASLGDTVAEIGNLVNTTQGSPNIEYKTSLSDRQQAMYDRLTADRNAREKKFTDAVTKARLQDIELELRKREQKRKEESDRALAEYRQGMLDAREREAAWKNDPNNPDYVKKTEQARRAAADAKTAEVRSQYAEPQAQATLARTNRTGTGRSSGGGGNEQRLEYLDPDNPNNDTVTSNRQGNSNSAYIEEQWAKLPESERSYSRNGTVSPAQKKQDVANHNNRVRSQRQSRGSMPGVRSGNNKTMPGVK